MIEHIELYLKQHHCRDYFNCYGETVKDYHYFMYRDEIDGLIELVVRECAKSANDWYQNNDKIHSDPMSYVLAHFGVEE